MKEVKEATYVKRTGEDFDKFLKALNGDNKSRSTLLCKSYNGGVIFGDQTHLSFIKNMDILSVAPEAREYYALETLFRDAYKNISEYQKATVTRGSTDYQKNALKLEGGEITAIINEKLVGDIPKGATFHIISHKAPVLVVYNDEIIKVVLPIVNVAFKEAI